MPLNPKYFTIAVLPDAVLDAMIGQTHTGINIAKTESNDVALKAFSDALMDLMAEKAYRQYLIEKGKN